MSRSACIGFRVRRFFGSWVWNCWRKGYRFVLRIKRWFDEIEESTWAFRFWKTNERAFIWACKEGVEERIIWCIVVVEWHL